MKPALAGKIEDPVLAKKMESQISGRPHDFDIISLLRLLVFLGYASEEIRFKSYNSLCSQAGLIKKIRFQHHPVKTVTITLNMGLLSAQGTLPNYFQKTIDKGMMDVPSFYEFIGYFDHALMTNFFKHAYPELNLNRLLHLEQAKSSYLQMLDLRSCATLNWMFRLVFPELEVSVDKSIFPRNVPMKSLKLGYTILGDNAVFGNKTSIAVSGRKIMLFCDEEITPTGEPWPKEIKKRLKELVFPVLRTIGIDLQVTLVIKSQKQWVKLNQDSYLGYDKIRGGSDRYKQIRIFNGHISPS
ncbi:MAG: type VI secretion system baseplate subunit TssG [Proteobacteria bacterium]|nr:type VI secretion system baseplate subunit TssG [Pseudomonadota bacterium]MBU1584007.1 type VI secretion system baseplate subunit TssG [Pseudomonadota bacterium]MBU2453056.1 type VI secretion system baseplate subunit TssG [Pseudomonadota bacterium]MBU2630909.1 type VI secretion system baseplate subunit TssG [Pseudomonadota bacterium]